MIRILENFSIQHPEKNVSYRFIEGTQYDIVNQTVQAVTVLITDGDPVWEGQVEIPALFDGETYEHTAPQA